MRGQTADPAERSQRTRALRERRFGDVRSGWTGAGVLLGRHEYMVAKTARQLEQFGLRLEPIYSLTGGRRKQIADQWAVLPRGDSMKRRVFVFIAIVMLAAVKHANITIALETHTRLLIRESSLGRVAH